MNFFTPPNTPAKSTSGTPVATPDDKPIVRPDPVPEGVVRGVHILRPNGQTVQVLNPVNHNVNGFRADLFNGPAPFVIPTGTLVHAMVMPPLHAPAPAAAVVVPAPQAGPPPAAQAVAPAPRLSDTSVESIFSG